MEKCSEKLRQGRIKVKILAIEASGLTAGCALAEDGRLIGDYNIQYQKTHSQTLVPMLDELKRMTDLDLSSLDAIAITAGPGSFTGLRIGAATAKGIGLALEKPILPVPTVDSLAFNLFGTPDLVCPVMDARRRQVYTGIYEEREKPVCVRPQCAISVEELAEDLNGRGRDVIFLGDGVPVYQKTLDELVKVPHRYAPGHLALQRAASTAVLAELFYEERGEACLVSSDDFRPEYLRKSQAERQREEAELHGKMASLAAGRLVRDLEAEKST